MDKNYFVLKDITLKRIIIVVYWSQNVNNDEFQTVDIHNHLYNTKNVRKLKAEIHTFEYTHIE